MIVSLPQAVRERLTRLLLTLLALVAWLLPLAPAHAASTLPDASSSWPVLRKELESLQNQSGIYTSQQARRLADLSRLDTAIDHPANRPTVENSTTHNLGVFVRAKRQTPDQPATFAVLAAGHETDDDLDTVALWIPANVPVSWPGRQPETTATPARVVRLLPGEELRVLEGEGGKGYHLSLPAFLLDTETPDLAALPAFNQEELDAQPETAPVD